MRRVVVRYKLKADRVAENEELVRAVFAELEMKKPDGLSYTTVKLPDGVSFMHIAFVSAAENPLFALETFKRFTSAIKERCEEPPVTSELETIGAYGRFAG